MNQFQPLVSSGLLRNCKSQRQRKKLLNGRLKQFKQAKQMRAARMMDIAAAYLQHFYILLLINCYNNLRKAYKLSSARDEFPIWYMLSESNLFSAPVCVFIIIIQLNQNKHFNIKFGISHFIIRVSFLHYKTPPKLKSL